MEKLLFGATTYSPTSARTGSSGRSMLRMQNLIHAGVDEDIYFECYRGSLSLDEPIPTLNLTGTLTAAEGELTIVGAGTLFTTELRSGQFFWAGDEIFMVDLITDDTHLTVYRALTAPLVAAVGQRTPIIYNLDRQRATQIQGNTEQFDRGTILGTGWGELRINGQPLQGSSLVFTGGPRVALFDPPTGNYATADVGFDTPTINPALTGVAGGTKGMVAGEYSLRFVPSSSITQGYSLPGTRINVTLAAANDRIQADFTGVPMDTVALQDQWDAYGTQLGVVNVNQGPWNFIRSITAAEITAGGNIVFIEYLNAEIARQGELDFDADPPPISAGFMVPLQGNPQWVSCYGKWGGSPGPMLIPALFNNLEAAPAIWSVSSSPPEDIIGVTASLARLYLLCGESLQQGVYAPTGDPLVPPTQIRTYWSMGFANPNQLMFALGLLVGYPHSGPTRSIADVETVDAQFLGANVAEILKAWTGAHVLVEWDADPMVNAAVFFHPAVERNDDGFWVTDALLWGFNQQDWIGAVRISDPTHDMIVTSVANVNNKLYFIAGGSNGGTRQVESQVATASPVSVSGNAVVTVTAAGMTNSPKAVTVPVLVGDGSESVAIKVVNALQADPDVGAFFTFYGGSVGVFNLVVQTAAANDATMNVAIAPGTAVGISPQAVSVNTTAGVAPVVTFDTFSWNEPAGVEVEYYGVWEMQSGTILDRNKSVKAGRVNWRGSNNKLQIYGFDSNTDEALDDLITGNNPQIEINVGTSTDVKTSHRFPFNAPNNFMFAPRWSGTYSGEGEPDRVSGIALEYFPSGVRR